MRIVLMADGDTDYLFMERVLQDDPELSSLPIEMVRPEDIGLKRRSGGGHKTLLKESGLAVIMAAKGHAEGVLVLVDNDGDPRFTFPHAVRCTDCRECEAWASLEKINWGQPIERGAAIVYQAVETLILSAGSSFNPQLEKSLFRGALKRCLYGREITSPQERYQAFEAALQEIRVERTTAKAYPRMKRVLRTMVSGA